MRLRLGFVGLVLLVILCALPVAAEDYYLPIAGSVGSFRTDVRIFNPSKTAESHVVATFLPAGNINNAERPPQSASVTVVRSSVVAYDDIVTSFFGATGLGAVYITGDTPLIITCRIYAQTASGTLGQGYTALRLGDSLLDGALVQLRSDGAFRTNIGVANMQNRPVDVTFSLYDKNSAFVSSRTITIQNYGVIAPTNITSGFFFATADADLRDAHVRFHSDGPIGVYASVVDNATTDPTFFWATGTN